MSPIIRLNGENSNSVAVNQEIECPRCHDIMVLCSDFDRLFYVYGECDFLVSMN